MKTFIPILLGIVLGVCSGAIIWGVLEEPESAITDPNEPPVWGKGDLPAEYTANFGDDNGARLDYVQNQVLDKHNKVIAEIAKRVIALEGGDPNEQEANSNIKDLNSGK